MRRNKERRKSDFREQLIRNAQLLRQNSGIRTTEERTRQKRMSVNFWSSIPKSFERIWLMIVTYKGQPLEYQAPTIIYIQQELIDLTIICSDFTSCLCLIGLGSCSCSVVPAQEPCLPYREANLILTTQDTHGIWSSFLSVLLYIQICIRRNTLCYYRARRKVFGIEPCTIWQNVM